MSIPFIDFKEQNRQIQGEVDLGFKKGDTMDAVLLIGAFALLLLILRRP